MRRFEVLTLNQALNTTIRKRLVLMERRDFIKTMVGGAFASVLMPGLLPQFMIRQYAAMPSLGWEPDEGVRI